MNNNSQALRFTQEQKEAVIYALYQISRSDSDLDESELEMITRVSELLGEVFDHMSISELVVENSYSHVNTLTSFNDVQKEWFVVSAYAMINCDDKLFDEEFSVAQGFFQIMGISAEKGADIIQKMRGKVRTY